MASQHIGRSDDILAMVGYDDQKYDRGPVPPCGRILSFTSWTAQPACNSSPGFTCNSKDVSDSFCNCAKTNGVKYVCKCGEEDTDFSWVWDKESTYFATQLSPDCREVKFHQEYSCGTAAVRGAEPMKNKQHYWEIKMTTPVYGTDMMIGVGTSAAKLDAYRYNFCSLLGSDSESWGLSYTGNLYHNGEVKKYAPKFGRGSIIGVHLDTWNGTITFYKNRQSLGVAYENLQGKTVYPMLSSTAARSGMKLTKSRSFDTSLQYLCVRALKKSVPENTSITDALHFPPGLTKILQNSLDWMVGPKLADAVNGENQSAKRKHAEIEIEIETENDIMSNKRHRFVQKSSSHSFNA